MNNNSSNSFVYRKCAFGLTISLVVKDAGETLENTLKSLIPLKEKIKCEIIITDIGSTDNTIEIANKYADKVLSFEWCDDFAKANNAAVDASDGEWFMIVNSGEVFNDEIDEIACLINSPDRDTHDSAAFITKDDVKNKNQNQNYLKINTSRLFNFAKEKRCFQGKAYGYIKIDPSKLLGVVATNECFEHIVNSFESKCERSLSYISDKIKCQTISIDDKKELIDNEILECLYFYALRSYDEEKYSDALEKLLIFKLLFDFYKLNFDELLSFNFGDFTNDKPIYSILYNNIVDCYIKLDDNDQAIKFLNEINLTQYDLTSENFVNKFLLNVIEFNQIDLFEKFLTWFENNNGIYNYSNNSIILMAKFSFYQDISYLIENYSEAQINSLFRLAFKEIDILKSIFYNICSNDIEATSLIEVQIYLKLAYWYLISQSNCLGEDSSLELKRQVEEVFIFYIETMIYFLNELYQPVIFQKQNLDVLTKEEAMCIIISDGFDNKDSDKVSYLKCLKEALEYNSNFKEIILNTIFIMENEDTIQKPQAQTQFSNSEYDELAKKVKESIILLIENNQFDQAKIVIEQYKNINPNDPDLEKFIKLMV